MLSGRKIKIILVSLLSLVLLSGLSIFFLKDYFVKRIIEKVQSKISRELHANLFIDNYKLSGISHLQLNDISLIPPEGDTLLKVKTVGISPDLIELIRGDIYLNRLIIEGVRLNITHTDSLNNYNFLFESDTLPINSNTETNWANKMNAIIKLTKKIIPPQLSAKDIEVKITGNNFVQTISLPLLQREDEKLSGQLSIDKNQIILIDGSLTKDMTEGAVSLVSQTPFHLTMIDSVFKTYAGVKQMQFAFKEMENSASQLSYALNAGCSDVSLKHQKISEDTVLINTIGFNGVVQLNEQSLSIDSTSKLKINKIAATIYARYTKTEKSNIIETKINSLQWNSSDFFESLPLGMFQNVRGIKTRGLLSYRMNCYIDFSLPDSLKFNSELIPSGLKIIGYGATNLSKMNGTFEYTAFEKGQPVKTFLVGPENPDYYSLNAISPHLRNAILCSEDGSFFWHKGFNPEAIQRSIAENIRAGKFVRGGSTISMQLIKNVFLTRKKTLSRKLEEVLIVWLIENNRLCSKEKMFEVYLNIIEFGPGVYGVADASLFYFGKKPGDLSLSEGIFLSSILPRPKWFMYSFDDKGNLKPYMTDYYKVVSRYLLARKQISENEYNDLKPELDLYSTAKRLLKSKPDTTLEKSELPQIDF